MAAEEIESDIEDFNCDTEYIRVQPYQFEPVVGAKVNDLPSDSSEEEEDKIGNQQLHRVQNVDWCSCGHCVPGDNGIESICCQEYSPIIHKCEELEATIKCITDHPGFRSNCLDQYVLETSFYEFCEDSGPIGNNQPIHKVYRYISYRRFVRWIWRKLGKKNRLPLPSCTRHSIRTRWPDQIYCGFKYAK